MPTQLWAGRLGYTLGERPSCTNDLAEMIVAEKGVKVGRRGRRPLAQPQAANAPKRDPSSDLTGRLLGSMRGRHRHRFSVCL